MAKEGWAKAARGGANEEEATGAGREPPADPWGVGMAKTTVPWQAGHPGSGEAGVEAKEARGQAEGVVEEGAGAASRAAEAWGAAAG